MKIIEFAHYVESSVCKFKYFHGVRDLSNLGTACTRSTRQNLFLALWLSMIQ